MSYPELTRRCAFAAKVEAVPGTAETLSWATDAIRLLGAAKPKLFYFAPNGREEALTGGLSRQAPIAPAGLCARTTIRFIPLGAGAAYSSSSKPNCAVILKAAGATETVVTTSGSETVTYKWNDDPTTTMTCYLEVSGKKFIFSGAVVESLKRTVTVGSYPVFEASIVGLVATAPAEQALEAATYSTVSAPLWKGTASLVVNSVSVGAQSFDIDYGLTAAPNTSANAADGLLFYKVTGRMPKANVKFTVPALTTFDPYALWDAATGMTIDSIIGVGEGQYKRLKDDINVATIVDVTDDDNAGMSQYSVDLLCSTDSTAEASIIFD